MDDPVQFRCPRSPRRMFGIIYSGPGAFPGALIEFACQECAQDLRKRGLIVSRVLHRFRLDGEFVETEHVGR